MQYRWAMLLAVFVLGGAFAVPPVARADEASDTLIDLYFAAMGGREVWASGAGEYVLARIQDPRFPLPGTFELCFSWTAPQTADRFRVQNFTQTRAYSGTNGWTFKKPSGADSGELSEWDEARQKRGYSEWSDNFEVLTHKMAKHDDGISTRMGEGPWKSWVEISVDQILTAYLLINEDGSPRRFFRVFDQLMVVFGPLAERGNLKFPAWGSFENGEPFDIIAFEILATAPREAFAKPAVDDPGYLHCQ